MMDDQERETRRESLMARRAREREEDRREGRPERGLFTGRGRRAPHSLQDAMDVDRSLGRPRASRDEYDDEDIDDQLDEDERGPRVRGRPRTGAKRTLMSAITQIPSYLRLMVGLMGDGRVSRIDRFLVLAAAAYMISPLDFIPDLIPFFGQADDVFLVVLALQRLIDNTGRRVLLDHWRGDPDDLSEVNITGLVSAAGFFLPPGIRKRLRRMAGRKR